MFLLLLWGALQLEKVQTYLGKRLAAYYSNELGTKIEIEKLSIDFFNTVELHHLYIEDQNTDTLAYLAALNIELKEWNSTEQELRANLELHSPKIYLRSDSLEEVFNYHFIQEYFSKSDENDTTSAINFEIDALSIQDGTFHFHDYNEGDSENEFNYHHMDVYSLQLSSSNLKFVNGGLSADIEELAFVEENGFDLKSLTTELTIDSSSFDFKNLKVKTAITSLMADIKFQADSMEHFKDFNSKVNIESNFKHSLIYSKDLAFFAPALKGIEDRMYLNGEIWGRINNLKGEQIEIQFNKETKLAGDFSLRGLPEVTETFIVLDLEEFRTSASGLRELPYPPFESQKPFPIPKSFDRLGKIWFSGNFTGYYNDFVAYGDFKSAIGSLETDIALKETEGEFHYRGSIQSDQIDLGLLTEVKELSNISFDLQIDGSGLDLNTIDANVIGTVNSLFFNNYNYQKIQLNGNITQDTYLGELRIKDKNLDLDFAGKIEMGEDKPSSEFNLKVAKAKLANTHLFNKKDTSTTLSFEASFNLDGLDIDELEGSTHIKELTYSDSKQRHQIEQFNLNSQKNNDSRLLGLESSVLDAKIEGKFKLKQLFQAYKQLLMSHLPAKEKVEVDLSLQDFQYSILFKQTASVTEVLLPQLSLDSGTTLIGSFNNTSNQSVLKLNGPQFTYANSSLENYAIIVESELDSFKVNLKAEGLGLLGLDDFDQLDLNASLSKGHNESKIKWEGVNQKLGAGEINFRSEVESLEEMQVDFYNSYVSINDSIWLMKSDGSTYIDSNCIEINNLSVSNNLQGIFIDGMISKDSTELLDIELKQINLEYVSSLLPKDLISLNGIANGSAQLRDVYNNFSLASDLRFKDLKTNGIEIGEAYVESKWNPEEKALDVHANLGQPKEELLELIGRVYPQRKENSLNLKLKMNQFPIGLMERYIEEYLSKLEGTISGSASIKGTAATPILEGRLQLEKASMLVNYLNTTYSLSDEIIVESDFIGFNIIDIYDSRGKKAIATGTIFHENYSKFNLDVGLEFEDFMALNTTAKNNDLYYGKAITSGIANISGYADQLIFEIDLTAEKGTNFSIPLDEGVDVASSDFLIFTNSPNYNTNSEEELDLSGIELIFDLKISPEADVQIIFDEQIGDIIKARGRGDLKLEINTIGNFNIYGQYVVNKGDYLFTLQNIVNKRFELDKGSRIYWDGDPYQAQLDLRAIYKLRAPLVDLFPEDSTSGFRRRTPVELELQMSSYLLSPEIGFDIRLPAVDEITRRRLESILYVNNNDVNRQEMNQQVFGLLVLNRFMPSSSAVNSADTYSRGAPGVNNGYEFLSNQLSNWFSSLSDQFDVGLNYRPANELNSDELDISLSTEVLNDRLILDGNFGYIGSSAQYVEEDGQTSNFIGEFSAEYKLSKDGRFRIKGFNRSTQNSLLQLNSPYTQGVGLFYREEFDRIGELWRKYFQTKK